MDVTRNVDEYIITSLYVFLMLLTFIYLFIYLSSSKDILIDLREWGREGGHKGEKH